MVGTGRGLGMSFPVIEMAWCRSIRANVELLESPGRKRRFLFGFRWFFVLRFRRRFLLGILGFFFDILGLRGGYLRRLWFGGWCRVRLGIARFRRLIL